MYIYIGGGREEREDAFSRVEWGVDVVILFIFDLENGKFRSICVCISASYVML